MLTDPIRCRLQPQLQSKLLNGGTVDHVHISAFPEGFNFSENMDRDWNGVWHGTQNIRLNLCRHGPDLQSSLTAPGARNRRGVQPFGIAILPRSAATAARPGKWTHGTTGAAGSQIGRWKSVIGLKLKSRSFSSQIQEIQLDQKVLNTMTALGRPVFERIT